MPPAQDLLCDGSGWQSRGRGCRARSRSRSHASSGHLQKMNLLELSSRSLLCGPSKSPSAVQPCSRSCCGLDNSTNAHMRRSIVPPKRRNEAPIEDLLRPRWLYTGETPGRPAATRSIRQHNDLTCHRVGSTRVVGDTRMERNVHLAPRRDLFGQARISTGE